MGLQELRDRVRGELEAAARAREAGDEGKARVSARRAAGWALGPYVSAHEGRPAYRNAYQSLRWLQSDRRAPARLREAARRLTARIRPDHSLPFEEDVLNDALMIANHYIDVEMDPMDFGGSEGREV